MRIAAAVLTLVALTIGVPSGTAYAQDGEYVQVDEVPEGELYKWCGANNGRGVAASIAPPVVPIIGIGEWRVGTEKDRQRLETASLGYAQIDARKKAQNFCQQSQATLVGKSVEFVNTRYETRGADACLAKQLAWRECLLHHEEEDFSKNAAYGSAEQYCREAKALSPDCAADYSVRAHVEVKFSCLGQRILKGCTVWRERIDRALGEADSMMAKGNYGDALRRYGEATDLNPMSERAAAGLRKAKEAIAKKEEQDRANADAALKEKGRLAAEAYRRQTEAGAAALRAKLDAEAHMTESQKFQMQMDRVSEALAQATPGQRGLAIGATAWGLGLPLIATLVADSEAIGAAEFAMPIGFNLPGLLTSLILVPGLNDDMRAERRRRGQKRLEVLENECSGGTTKSCSQGAELASRLADLKLDASERQNSSALAGPGSFWRGPAVQVRFSAGFVHDGIESENLNGSMTGVETETMLRVRMLRASFHTAQRYGSLVADDETHGIMSIGGSLGLQLGNGLFSPYVARRFRISFGTGENGKSVEDDGDEAWLIGNTFDLTGVFSSAGPLFSSMVLDAAMIHTEGGPFSTGWRLMAGWSFSNSIDIDTEMAPPKGRAPGYSDVFSAMIYPGGGGIELLRTNGASFLSRRAKELLSQGDAPSENWVFSAVELNVGFGAEGDFPIRRGGLIFLSWGPRVRLLGGRLELGARTGTLAAQLYEQQNGSETNDGSATIGFLPTRWFARTFVAGFPIEVGYHMPLVWMNLDERPSMNNPEESEWERSFSWLADGDIPGFAYIGLALF